MSCGTAQDAAHKVLGCPRKESPRGDPSLDYAKGKSPLSFNVIEHELTVLAILICFSNRNKKSSLQSVSQQFFDMQMSLYILLVNVCQMKVRVNVTYSCKQSD